MWEAYGEVVRKYRHISLKAERKLIARAQRGSRESRDEIMLRHIRFAIFRLRRKVFYPYLLRYGEDLLSEMIPLLLEKIDSYDLRYRDKDGRPKPVRFSSYIWKRVDGFIIDSMKKIVRTERMETAMEVEKMPGL